MARNQDPVTEEESETLREEMDAEREEVRETLAEDVGGEPEDYAVEKYLGDRAGEPVADGGGYGTTRTPPSVMSPYSALRSRGCPAR